MKKLYFSIVTFLFFSCSLFAQNTVTLESSKSDETILTVKVENFDFYDVQTHKGTEAVLKAADAHQIIKKGAPDLPKFVRSVIVPDYDLMKVEVISSKYHEIEDINIAPSKGYFMRSDDPASIPYTYGEWYTKNAFYPGNLTILNDPYILRDFRGQALDIYPFQYNPVSKTLRVYSEITVKISSAGERGKNVLDRSRSTESIDNELHNIYSRQFVNYEPNSRYTPMQEQGEMLIIAHSTFMSAMEPFVEWKNTIGMKTVMVSTSTTGTSWQNIKSYITDYYNNNDLMYVLFVGDAQHIPPIPSSGTDVIEGYSDNAYGYLVGTDRYQEVFIGRFSAETTAHVETQVQRILEYEQADNLASNWLNVAMGIARNEGSGMGHNGGEGDDQHMELIRNKLLSYNYATVHRDYDGNSSYSSNTTASNISNRINAGAGLINYCNHGSQTSWSVASYSNTHVNALTNVGKLPFIWSVACVNGQFQGATSFSETWLRATYNGQPTGALAFLGSTINQPWHPPMDAQDEFNDILIGSYTNNIKRTFGGLSVNGLFKMLDLNNETNGHKTAETWTIFGDPSVKVRTNNPTDMSVSHDSNITPGSDFVVQCDAAGAYAALTKNGQITSTADASGGSITLSTASLQSGDVVKLAITAYNKIPYIVELPVGTSSVMANFTANPTTIDAGQTVTFTDASSGSISSYSWDFGSGASPATASTIGPHSVTYNTAGSKTVSLTVNGSVQNVKEDLITVNSVVTCDPVSDFPYNEGFSDTSTPSCWTVTDNQGNGQVWKFGTISNGLSGASGNYAYLNSDGYGSGNTQNSDLVSPTYDFSGYSSVTLSFKHYFRQYNTVSTATLSYSLNGGSTWTQIQSWDSSTSNPLTFNQEIDAVAGKSDVKFKWNYTGTWGYYWCIDDIQITGSQQTQQYTLTMAANGSGSVSPFPGTHTYNEGTAVNISASPSSGNVFDKWVINGSDYTSSSMQLTMNSNITATAYFVADTPTCTPLTSINEGFSSSTLPECWENADNQGNGQVWKFGTVSNGLTGVSGNYAYLDSDGYGSGNSQNADLISPTLDLSAYGTVNVSFKHYFRQYQTSSTAKLSYSTDNGATWTQVQQWTATTSNPATFDTDIPAVAGQSQVKFKWNYTGSYGYYWCIDDVQISGSSGPQQYTLTMDASGNGSTSPAVGSHSYNSGESVTLTANPASGHEFVKWVINGSDNTSQTVNISMNADVNATAHFAPIQYTLTLAKDGEGSTTPAVGTHTYDAGESISLNASPASGNQFVKWVINGNDNTNQSVNITMNSNVTATAYFIANTQYTLSVSINGNGSTTPAPGTYNYEQGASASISATPAAGNDFVKWVINGTDYTATEHNLTMNENHTAVAHFAPQEGDCVAYTLPFNEGFSAGSLPECWEIVDHQGNGQVWQFGTGGSLSGANGNYAYLNSDAYGNGSSQNADLITPTLDLGEYSTVTVSFKHYFRQYNDVSTAKFYYSTNNGASWTQIQSWTASTANPTAFEMEIPEVAGNSQVKFKWNYAGSWGYYWSIDDVQITGTSGDVCTYTLPFSEDYNASTSVPECWDVIDNQGNNQVWKFGTLNNGLSGTSGNYAFLDSDGYGSGNSQNADLITPTLNLSAYSSVNVSFKHYFRQYQTSSTARLYYSIDDGASWTQIQSWTSTTTNAATFNQDISAVAGKSQVKFKWNYTGSWGYYWCIDDLVISGSSKSGAEKPILAGFNIIKAEIYPNPASDKVSVSLTGIENHTEIQLLNIHGQVLRTLNVSNTETMQTQDIILGEFKSGVYFIRIVSENFIETKRLIIK